MFRVTARVLKSSPATSRSHLNPFKDGFDPAAVRQSLQDITKDRFDAATVKATGQRVLQQISTTVWDIMAKSIPKDQREIFAQKWGFSTTVNGSALPAAKAAADAAAAAAGAPLSQSAAAASAGASMDASVGAALEQSVVKATSSATPAAAAAEQVAMPDLEALKQEAMAAAVAAVAAAQPQPHDVYGELVHDLGYKKMYLTSVERLVRAPIWQRQRILRPERAQAMATDKMKGLARGGGGRAKGMPGVITLYQDSSDPDNTAIVDGQHRVAALMIMSEAGAWDKAAHNVAVDVVPTSSEQEVCDLFTEINKAEPVRLVDMPGEGAAAHERAVLAEVATAIGEKYAAMVKPSSRCKAPHINLDVFRDEVFQSGLMSRHNLHTTAQLLAWLEQANDTLSKRDEAQWKDALSGRTASTALKKARANHFYLGLDKAWLHI